MRDCRIFLFSALLGVVFLVPGCQGRDAPPEGMPDLYPTSVTILQEGVPLAEASICLIPDEGTSPWSSGGSTDPNGVAVLRTHGKFPGVPAGSYRMTVSKIKMPPPVSADLSALDAPPRAEEPTYDLVAPEYAYPNQTSLRLEVRSGANRYEPFDLGPAVSIERTGPPSPGSG